MRCDIAVDNMRIRYPVLHKRHRALPKFHFSCLTDTQALDGAIHLVTVDGAKYIHKLIHRTSYYPPDSQHIIDEIDAYLQFRGTPHIAQIAGLVVSEYPYRTHPATPEKPVNKAEVIVGFLLPFYAGGSLWSLTNNPMKFAEAMAKHRAQGRFFPGPQTPLLKWARQIAAALQSMHGAGKPHMDVKPANVVLDGQNNAVLIDISGLAGWTYEYLSPEMSEIVEDDREIDIMAIPIHVRVQNDCWAYGMILDALARAAADIGGEDVELVRGVAACMMRCKAEARISLEDALAMLVQ
ncbi:kinase-like domain-containing protein [Aspergillus pseudoustus]|uniref:non-specific serine/threonine protein kinase n=1 Tax=Aspergillus pseudoustus TaxID=1810923 RepID=A0ABR4JRS6_9EURO